MANLDLAQFGIEVSRTGILHPQKRLHFRVTFHAVIYGDRLPDLDPVSMSLVEIDGIAMFSPSYNPNVVHIVVQDDCASEVARAIVKLRDEHRFVICIDYLDGNGGVSRSHWLHDCSVDNVHFDALSYKAGSTVNAYSLNISESTTVKDDAVPILKALRGSRLEFSDRPADDLLTNIVLAVSYSDVTVKFPTE